MLLKTFTVLALTSTESSSGFKHASKCLTMTAFSSSFNCFLASSFSKYLAKPITAFWRKCGSGFLRSSWSFGIGSILSSNFFFIFIYI